MVAVALPVGVERDEQEVGPLQLQQPRRRPGLLEQGVAELTRQPVQHRGARQERERLGGEIVEHGLLQVVGHQPVVAGERGDAGRGIAQHTEAQGGEPQPCGPALRPCQDPLQRPGRQRDPGRRHRCARLLGPEGEVAGRRARSLPSTSRRLEQQVRVGPAPQRDTAAEGQVGDEPGDDLERIALTRGRRRVVQHQQEWSGGVRERLADLVEQPSRAAVVPPQAQPPHRARERARPLGQQGRLSIAGRRRHEDEARAGGVAQVAHQRAALDLVRRRVRDRGGVGAPRSRRSAVTAACRDVLEVVSPRGHSDTWIGLRKPYPADPPGRPIVSPRCPPPPLGGHENGEGPPASLRGGCPHEGHRRARSHRGDAEWGGRASACTDAGRHSPVPGSEEG